MSASDELKAYRQKGYAEKRTDEGMDSGDTHETPRIISLTDDEKKAFEQAKPGDDLACEVHGTLEADGHFHVMSVSPMGGGASDGDDMASEVAERVMPGIQKGPSA